MSERTTALYEAHAALGAHFTDFGGWQMPLRYGSELAEHTAVRTAAGLFDLSHMGEVWVQGPDAAAALSHALVGVFEPLAVGRAKYSLIVAQDGGILDDLIVYRITPERFLVVPNAGNAELVFTELTTRAAGFTATVTDASAHTALIALQGPRAAEILTGLLPEAEHETLAALRYYAAHEFSIDDQPVLVARTGYTGEDGFELFIPDTAAPGLWDTLLAAGLTRGLIPCGLAARDSLRLEAGMPLYGNELTSALTPFDAGFDRVVNLDEGHDFVGRAALEAAHATGVRRVLVGLRGEGRRAARAGYPILVDGEAVGTVTSGQPSPTLGFPIAFAYIDPAYATPGTPVQADLRGKPEAFTVTATPFYRRTR
ncbi:glycine cleavage system aminomethyltransferase GcvT [Mycetocola tolaasinivorans]|uniref:Aminomethyltransferase n=1 Tax=Mycetocola tolaasinivorans TaxID=76635 RepID=A0A3L7A5C0_9MICO|nr:glycine cleavage system aminomethyltransferase GcvT [Mycetocola tolaasinivorans]RLP75245.1 glycine cleavage system aminomethyltransferase GcvT [Mycetocola tolaasinivorans]